MKKADFIAQFKSHKKKNLLYYSICLPALSFGCLGLAYLNNPSVPKWCFWMGFVFFAYFYYWSFRYALKSFKETLIKRGLFCSQCSHHFSNDDSKKVISTGKCPYCSFAVIDG